MTDPAASWVGDSGVDWRILLTAHLTEPMTAPDLQAALDTVTAAQGWSASQVRSAASADELRTALATGSQPVVVGLAGHDLVISAHHAFVDGLGLLDLLGPLAGTPATSTARGVADREERAGGFAAAAVRRLGEVAFAPPTAPAFRPQPGRSGEVMVEREVAGTVSTSRLVTAAVGSVVAFNDARDRRSRHVSVAVGAGRPVPADEVGTIRDRSALIRLRDLAGLDEAEVRRRVQSAPLEPTPHAGGAGGRLTSTAVRLLSRRLGSTLLVSHLGAVTAPGVGRLAFHPVTAGRTGLSLGAVTVDGTTVLTLRTRAANADRGELSDLLDGVAAGLGS